MAAASAVGSFIASRESNSFNKAIFSPFKPKRLCRWLDNDRAPLGRATSSRTRCAS